MFHAILGTYYITYISYLYNSNVIKLLVSVVTLILNWEEDLHRRSLMSDPIMYLYA